MLVENIPRSRLKRQVSQRTGVGQWAVSLRSVENATFVPRGAQGTLCRCAWDTRLRSDSGCIYVLMGARQKSHKTRPSSSVSRLAGPYATLLGCRILIWVPDLEVVWPSLWSYERFGPLTGMEPKGFEQRNLALSTLGHGLLTSIARCGITILEAMASGAGVSCVLLPSSCGKRHARWNAHCFSFRFLRLMNQVRYTDPVVGVYHFSPSYS